MVKTRRPAVRRALVTVPAVVGLLVASLPTGAAGAAPAGARTPADPPAMAGPDQPVPADKIHSTLRTEIAESGSDELEALVVLGAEPASDSAAQAADVLPALERTASASQAPVVELVEGRGGRVLNSFWLQNMLLVRVAPATLEELAVTTAVDRILPNFEVTLPEPTGEPQPGDAAPTAEPAAQTTGETDAGDATWGLERIGADRVPDELGITGEDVRVAVLDTGVDIDHPDLAGRMVTDDPSDLTYPGGWIEFDGEGETVSSSPHDTSYHGTHVAGTVLGGDTSGTRIGVAPEADLMAGVVIPDGSGTFAQVIAGLEWAADPVDADGEPAGEPADVVNLSLGGCGLTQEMVTPTRNLRAAGIFPAFAIGNDDPFTCPSCGPFDTASPANVYEAVAVGATDTADDVADASCGGVVQAADWPDPPADWPDRYVKPDLTAPGVDIDSAAPGGGYLRISGTSMATPHVAGTAALMYQAEPGISVGTARELLVSTAFFDDRYGSPRPNPRFGWGRIDAYAAVSLSLLETGLTGTVTDEDGRPVADATVTATGAERSVVTDADGGYELRLPAGEYTVEFSRFGYEEASRIGVTVGGDGLTRLDVELESATRGRISGRVTYGPTGTRVPGVTVAVQGVPDDLSATTARQGKYRIEGVPVGTYEVVATGPDGARSAVAEVTVRNPGNHKRDLTLGRPPATSRVSLTASGAEGNGGSQWPSISADGRYVAFGSLANNVVAGDTNGQPDVFLRDRQTGLLELISVGVDGAIGNGFSLSPQLSADGRYVGFNSNATNLTEDASNGLTHAYVRDLREGVTEQVSVAFDGGQPEGSSGSPMLSADGSVAVFRSDASNLVEGDTNDATDVFLYDRATGVTERVSEAPDGGDGDRQSRDPVVSADGRFVAYHSDATNLVEGDTNDTTDVFVYDRDEGTTVRISGPGEGSTRGPALSPDGSVVVYSSRPARFAVAQLYAQDLATGETELISVAHDGDGGGTLSSSAASLSTDGSVVVFSSSADNLVEGDTNSRGDVFVRDREAGTTQRVSVTPDGGEVAETSALPVVTPDGRYVSFQTRASDLVADDGNAQNDVFVRDLRPEEPTARFAVGDLQVRQPQVRPGQDSLVMVPVANVGDRFGEYDVVLRVDGAVEQTATIDLVPGSWKWAKFRVSRLEPGDYTLAVGPATGELTVLPGRR